MPKKQLSLLEAITKPTGRDRGPVERGSFATEDRVDPDGGEKNAGIIFGASVIHAGEALGHYAWIDGVALDQVVELGNAMENGAKVRFTHPSMSGDGLGSYLGRAKNFKRDGDQVFADIHLSESAKNSPDGDLSSYVLELADDDPESFGMSIVNGPPSIGPSSARIGASTSKK